MIRRLAVAGCRGSGQPGKHAAAMAACARLLGMGSGQWEAGALVVERHFRPGCGHVAGLAILTVLPLVIVIRGVAAEACGWCSAEGSRLVALLTIEKHVGARQWEGGVVVVENKITPCGRLMAFLAFHAKAASMAVVFLVATDTLLRDVNPSPITMTVLTGNFNVGAYQRVRRQGVIEGCRLPAGRCVAPLTGRSQRGPMDVVLKVTSRA
jgi:hypothetical protein